VIPRHTAVRERAIFALEGREALADTRRDGVLRVGTHAVAVIRAVANARGWRLVTDLAIPAFMARTAASEPIATNSRSGHHTVSVAGALKCVGTARTGSNVTRLAPPAQMAKTKAFLRIALAVATAVVGALLPWLGHDI